jgi:hypothetical protein
MLAWVREPIREAMANQEGPEPKVFLIKFAAVLAIAIRTASSDSQFMLPSHELDHLIHQAKLSP